MRRLTLVNNLSAVDEASVWLRALAEEVGLGAEDTYRLDLCASELLANIVSHAFDDQGLHHIDLGVAVSDRDVMFEVVDDGRPFDPIAHPLAAPATSLAETSPGGWGLRLVRRFADECRYERRGSMNVVSIVLHRHDAPAGS
jgi:anti-sigma regulatory factor (Ser/Thr protein kinase)